MPKRLSQPLIDGFCRTCGEPLQRTHDDAHVLLVRSIDGGAWGVLCPGCGTHLTDADRDLIPVSDAGTDLVLRELLEAANV